jgi:hypothetical protein
MGGRDDCEPIDPSIKARSLFVMVYFLALMLVSGASQSGLSNGKSARTTAQKKISSALLDEVRRLQQDPERKTDGDANSLVKIDSKARALVDIRVAITTEMKQRVISLGGTIVSESAPADSIIAWLPLAKIERVAEYSAVRAIQPADQPTTYR